MDIGQLYSVSLPLTTLLLLTVFTRRCDGAGTGKCTTKGTCKCIYEDGSYIDLHDIAKKDSFAFDYQQSEALGSPFLYAYNPCYPVTDNECKSVAGCQKNSDEGRHFPIGDAKSAQFAGSDSNVAIEYSSTDGEGTTRKLEVILSCDQSATTPILHVKGELVEPKSYQYTLNSVCCCPNGCSTTSDGGLSFGSVLCILVSCLLVVYIVAGVLFMKFVRKAEGKELIPNYSMWIELPGLVKDGAKYTYSSIVHLFKKESSGYTDI